MDAFKGEIATRVANALGLPPGEVESLLEAPKDPKRGDIALPCFKLAKPLAREGKDAAMKIAKEVVEKTDKGTVLSEISAAGPFVNFRLAPGALARSVLEAVARPGRYGGSDEGKGKTIVIDYSSPNIAKPFHLGHLRSTVIGHAIRKLYESLGYRVEGVNHLGDWGTQFGFMLAAWARWKDEAEKRIAGGEGEIDVFVSLYVKINQLAKQDASVRDEARAWFKKLEEGDAEARRLWRYFVDRSKQEFDRIYKILGIHHESDAGESFYNDKMGRVLELVRQKSLLVKGHAAPAKEDDEDDLGNAAADARPEGVDLGKMDEGGLGFTILLKADGATNYATRDLAAAYYREEHYHPEKIVYVVGAPQTLHFQRLKKILELMGATWHAKVVHVPFGQYLGMKTREGNVVFLDEVLEKAKEVAVQAGEAATKKQDLTADEIAENARKIGAGAVKFFDLKNDRMKDIALPKLADNKIDLERVLATHGETGPYVQFSYARLSGVIRKLGFEPSTDVDYTKLVEPEAAALLKALGEHPMKVRLALAEHEPSVVARHLIDVASAAHSFLHAHRVIDAPDDVKKARALLVSCARKVVGQCLELLGIEPLEKM